MDRPSSQYCTEETEFSLPEGVDLVGTENSRKSVGYPNPNLNLSLNSGGNRKNKKPGWKSAVKLVVINLFVCALVLGYALVGSFVFLALEGNRNNVSPNSVLVSASGYPVNNIGANLSLAISKSLQGEQIQQLKSDTVRNIWEITLSMNILYPDNWTKMTSEEVGNFQKFLVERILSVVENTTVQETPYSWTFPRAFLFALTTLTTIGMGVGPKTSSAKIATMIYAIFGIPIMLCFLSNIGSLLAKIARFVCARLCCCCCVRDSKGCSSSSSSSTSSSRKVSDPYYHIKPVDVDRDRGGGGMGGGGTLEHHHHHHRHHPHLTLQQQQQLLDELEGRERVSIVVILILCLALFLAYVCLGSYIVTRWEKWRFLDAFYFCFLTLTTISFGDAHKKGGLDRLNTRTEWFCSFFILFGMALTSMFFNILHEEISVRFKRWKQFSAPHGMLDHLDGGGGGGGGKDSSSLPGRGSNGGTGSKGKMRPVENSYSVHFMNFSSPNATGTSRNYTEETLLSNEMHNSKRSMTDSVDKGMYDDEDLSLPQDYIVSHPVPREIYGSHAVFPR